MANCVWGIFCPILGCRACQEVLYHHSTPYYLTILSNFSILIQKIIFFRKKSQKCSYGVLFVEILEIFSTSSTAVASWIPAILSALCLALAPLSSALCQRFSCRTVVFIGGLFCALGLMLSYFATSLYHLLFTFGILTGS